MPVITVLPGMYYLFQDSDYMSNDSKVAPERSQIRNYVTTSSSAVDSRRYTSNLVKSSPTKKGKCFFLPKLILMIPETFVKS